MYKNPQHCNSKDDIVHICVDKNMLLIVRKEKIEAFRQSEFYDIYVYTVVIIKVVQSKYCNISIHHVGYQYASTRVVLCHSIVKHALQGDNLKTCYA